MLDPASVTVKIYGQEYTLKGEADVDYVQEVARYVDTRMKEISDSSTVAMTAKVAILAAINIADELFRERQKRQEALSLLDKKSGQMADLLGKEVGKL